MRLDKMGKNKKILFSGIFLAVVSVIILAAPTKISHASGWDEFTNPVSSLLYIIFLGVNLLLGLAGMLFDYVINPQNFTDVMNMQAVYNGWKMVRDFFNIAFILVLLFSAFSTIFQVEKFHIKKILLNLVIIALLVNFSYPIALFIIDSSNVLMYYLLNTAFPGDNSSISAGFAKFTDIGKILIPMSNGELDYGATNLKTKLFMAIIFVFILMATMMVLAMLLVVRLIVLVILVILAPAAFVSGILPSTKNYSDDWWKNLFKYSFFGPSMAFMMLIAMNMMVEMKNSKPYQSIQNLTSSNSADTGDASYLATAVFFCIPIVILWIGMIISQKMGIMGASTVVGKAQGVAKWAGKKFSGYDAVKKRYDAFSAERKKRTDEKFKGNIGEKFGNWMNRAQDTAHSKLMLAPGSDAAYKRSKKWDKEANKADIKREKEGAESLGANEIINNIKDVSDKEKRGESSDADRIKRAGQASELLSRGKEFEDQLGTMDDNHDFFNSLDISDDIAAIRSAGGDPRGQKAAIAVRVREKLRNQVAEAEKQSKSIIREPLVAAGAGALKGLAAAGAVTAIAGAAAFHPVAGAATYAAMEGLATGKRRDRFKNPKATASQFAAKVKGVKGEAKKFKDDVWNKTKERAPRD